MEKCLHPYHNLFLSSGHKKNNFRCVTIKINYKFIKLLKYKILRHINANEC